MCVSAKAMSARQEQSSRLVCWKVQANSRKSVLETYGWDKHHHCLSMLLFCAFQALAFLCVSCKILEKGIAYTFKGLHWVLSQSFQLVSVGQTRPGSNMENFWWFYVFICSPLTTDSRQEPQSALGSCSTSRNHHQKKNTVWIAVATMQVILCSFSMTLEIPGDSLCQSRGPPLFVGARHCSSAVVSVWCEGKLSICSYKIILNKVTYTELTKDM